ncbi:MAG: hypothetical protein QM775_11335 [Pirellulales bacterium]
MTSLHTAWRFIAPVAAAIAALSAEMATGKMPSFGDVQTLVTTHFESRKNYHDGDLITLGDVAPLVKLLEKQGFDVRRKEQGAVMLLADDHPLARILRSKDGAKLTELVRGRPEAMDRLARLATFPQGREIVMTLARSADAEALTMLCTVDAAREIEAMYPNEPSCRNLEAGSGLVFTVEQYVSHLQSMHTLARLNLSRPATNELRPSSSFARLSCVHHHHSRIGPPVEHVRRGAAPPSSNSPCACQF